MGKESTFLSAMHLKKKPMKKFTSKRNQFFNKVFDYLKSDTYMFAPLYSSGFSSGIEEDNNKPLERNEKKLISKIGDYLMADTYMYAPLVISQPWDSVHVSKGPVPIQEKMDRKRSADVLKGGTGKEDEAGRKTVNVVSKDHKMNGSPHSRSPMVTRTRVRRETVKHMIYQNCSPLFASCILSWRMCLVIQPLGFGYPSLPSMVDFSSLIEDVPLFLPLLVHRCNFQKLLN